MSIPIEKTQQLIQDCENLVGWQSEQFQAWHSILNGIENRLEEPLIRIAVIGSVKSGKSSLVNALLGKDLLRRGAGVLTAAITRIRPAMENRANIVLKSWLEINSMMERSAILLCQSLEINLELPLDFRSAATRKELKSLVDAADSDAIDFDPFSEDRILLRSLLDGYLEMSPHLDEDGSSVIWHDEETALHRKWVSRDECAVYLEDVLLEENSLKWKNFEITDCQGNDSANPAHFAMVQQYLASSSRVIYVISSRTGIRQADLELLQTLRELRLLEQTLFVINLDLSELETEVEAQRVLKQIQNDLKRWTKSPEVIAVSGLAALFSALKSKRTSTESSRLRLWKKTSPLYSQHEDSWKLLNQTISGFTSESSLSADKEMAEKIHWKNLAFQFHTFLEDAQERTKEKNLQNLRKQQLALKTKTSLDQTKAAFNASIDSSLLRWKDRVETEMVSIFESLEGQPVLNKMEYFIKNYSPYHHFNEDTSQTNSQKIILKKVLVWHQELQKEFLNFVAAEINAPLLREIKNLENTIIDDLQHVCSPFFTLLSSDQETGTEKSYISVGKFPELPLITFSFSLNSRESDRLRGISLLSKGLIQGLGKAAWSRLTGNKNEVKKTLFNKIREQAMQSLKDEALENLAFDVHNYQQNIAFLHLYKGLELMIQDLKKEINHLISSKITDYVELDKRVAEELLKKSDFPLQMERIMRELSSLENEL